MLISSDSDDDSPDKIFQRLERNKRILRAQQNTLEYNSTIGNSSNDEDVILVSESYENRRPYTRSITSSFPNDDVVIVSDTYSASKSPSTVDDRTKNYDSTDLFLNGPLVETAPSRRGKRKKGVNYIDNILPTTTGKRGRGAKKGTRGSGNSKRGRGRGKSTTPTTPEVPSFEPVRGRSRGRQGRGRANNSPISLDTPELPRRTRRQNLSQRLSSSIPTYNIGNTHEYPDASEDIALFKNTPEKTINNDLDTSIDNEELSVKVLWQSLEVVKFKIRKLQKLSQIFDFFSEREGVSKEKLLFLYNNNILKPDDTPDSIDYSFVKFIDGGVTSTSLLQETTKTVIHGFKLKFQCQGRKQPYVVGIGREDKLQVALIKCAEHLEVPIANLRFEFDGETVRGNLTPKDLDMDSGDCIDVKILNVNK
ncbi:uncharacterized protein [Epargyreus clarus]|uniref:uncharacterized protein n=1 Tax=Epargyreus clarus TaxID=520877 RepID=UPI003C2C2813